MIVVTWGAATDTGRVRARNEDSLVAQAPLFVVADGMGGHAGGAVASRLAVDVLRETLDRSPITTAGMKTTLQAANDAIIAAAHADPAAPLMGTTAVGLVLLTEADAEQWLAFNIGDSRIYRLRDGRLSQISVDHSYVHDLVLAGLLDPQSARTHPERSVITRALGIERVPVPDFWAFPALDGERFLLCSDGLSGELSDPQITQILTAAGDPREAARELVAAANAAGGRDNITAIVVDTTGSSQDDATGSSQDDVAGAT